MFPSRPRHFLAPGWLRAALIAPAACSYSCTPAASTDTAVQPSETPASPATSPPAAPHVTNQTKAELDAFVATRQTCAADADCVNVQGACPFGCYIPVVKTAEAETQAKLEDLVERLEKADRRCVYKCSAPPTAACLDGRCVTGAP